MRLHIDAVQPGDIIIIKQGGRLARAAIWLQNTLKHNTAKYSLYGHVIVATGKDPEGRLWGIEARPGGIGYRRLEPLNSTYGMVNTGQPVTAEARTALVAAIIALLGKPYDYEAYLLFVLKAVGIDPTWTYEFDGKDVPPHFICSAVAAYIYRDAGLGYPKVDGVRLCTPADWAEFIDTKGWVSR
jgi:hypothetical protein